MAANMDPGKSYMMITIILSLVGWPGSARTIRGMVHAIKREEFILNAKLEMIPPVNIIFNHIIPQIASLLIISVALSIPGFIMTETVLSYLGLGITDPAVSWGSLIKRDLSTLSNLRAFPWLLSPVWFLLGVTLAFNFIGDALRDFFDPYHAVFSKKIKLMGRVSRRGAGDSRKSIFFEDFTQRHEVHRGHKGRNKVLSYQINSYTPRLNCKLHFSYLFSLFLRVLCALCASVRTSFSKVKIDSKISLEPSCSDVSESNNEKNNTLIRIRSLKVTFNVLRGRDFINVYAVRDLSYSLDRGECLGIVGESGSGKSVSTLAIPGLLPKNTDVSGSILYNGKELLGLSTNELRKYRGKKIGMIFQEPGRSYDPLQSIGSVFWETFRNSEPSITRENSDEKAAALLDETGLDNGRSRLSNFPQQFSGGQLQRISIALALAQGCELLIADEPTTALDLTIQKQIIELLKALRQKRNLTVIFISHDIELVAEISDKIMVMYGGLLMESAPVRDIIENPRHPYTQALIAASPRFGSHYSKEKLAVIPGKTLDPAILNPGCPFAKRCAKMTQGCLTSVPEIKTSFTEDNRQLREIRCTII
jgi:oligopeptide/dipeptide ABC transporter ATP-binding protein